jgi:pyruvate,water dikinase
MATPFDDFDPGDIVVANTVDPGWSPVLACAGAIVLDLGGTMSHGVVVARELGIPAVVNVRLGTSLIESGSTIVVDGDAGTVEFGL